MHKYWALGLHIESEIEFPEFLEFRFKDQPDLVIKKGETPNELNDEGVIRTSISSITSNKYLLKLDKLANYYVTNGNEMIIEMHEGALLNTVRHFLVSSVMAAVVYQRNQILLHSSAILCKRGAVLFCGDSGVGKSTTIASLQTKGYAIFSDDVCVLLPGNEGILVIPSYPMMKLWEDTYEKVGLEPVNFRDRLRPDMAKYARFYHEDFHPDPVNISHIFLLEKSSAHSDLKVKDLSPFEAFSKLEKNAYKIMQLNAMKKRPIHFDLIAKLASSVPVTELVRPDSSNSLTELIKIIGDYLLQYQD